MKRINLFSILILSIIIFISANSNSSCENNAESQQREQTDALMNEMNEQIGMPAIKNFQERKIAKMIFELRDREDLVCYAYIVNHMTGQLIFLGKCIGYGLPYSVQYTNPEKPVYHSSGLITLPQADPNGLYMPTGLSATWLMMIDKRGEARPVYIEPEIIVSPFELK